uniref:Uncharacterized protein n=1 Tax=Arundo donax TaxID=35708 RepID=A0A0A8Y8R6_ARUDO
MSKGSTRVLVIYFL